MKSRTVLTLLLISLTSGCASITSSDMQNLALNATTEANEQVKGAKCTLKNDRGTWTAETPGFIEVRRSSEDLVVECKKEGLADGMLRAISRAAGGMFGNIIFGGGIGAIIDHSRGTGYNYPDSIPVVMGKSITVDRAQQNSPESEKSRTDPQQVSAQP